MEVPLYIDRLTPPTPGSPSPPAPVLEEEDDEVEMQVRPHPQDSSVANFPIRNLATVPMATVAHILKYIADYPTLDNRGMSCV